MKSKLIIMGAILVLAPSLAFALGFRVADQDAEATSRANAFAATADNPSAIYYNPAGITQLEGVNALFSTYGIYFQTKYTPASGDSVRTKDNPQALPQLFYTYTLKDYPLSFGIGSYAPYGFNLEYPDSAPFRPIALKGGIEYLTLNPVIAWRINSALSVAAGVTVNYANADLENGGAGLLPPGSRLAIKGDGFAAGFNAGVLWQPAKQHSFGINYHSATSMSLDGHVTYSIPGRAGARYSSKADFDFPQFLSGGYSFRPTPEWNFEFDVDWTDWHTLKTVMVDQQFAGPLPVPFNWKSSFFYEFGATRYFSNGYNVSAGYMYSTNSVPDSSFSPSLPDSNRHIFNAGFGQKKGRYSWDFAYQFAYGPTRTISNGSLADGQYRFISHAITFSIGYHF